MAFLYAPSLKQVTWYETHNTETKKLSVSISTDFFNIFHSVSIGISTTNVDSKLLSSSSSSTDISTSISYLMTKLSPSSQTSHKALLLYLCLFSPYSALYIFSHLLLGFPSGYLFTIFSSETIIFLSFFCSVLLSDFV